MFERGGCARSFHVAYVTGKTLAPILRTQVRCETAHVTDEVVQYRNVGAEFASHRKVNHGKGEYVRGHVHSNTVEGFFAILKRGVTGTFHQVSEAHLARYLAEFDFRYSHRSALGINDTMRTDELSRGIAGKRLTYRRTGEAAYAEAEGVTPARSPQQELMAVTGTTWRRTGNQAPCNAEPETAPTVPGS
ncbi:MAG: IS1595 family transposase [Phenylobacterium sp.]|nr:IS1595 family transposase [Phenylobacterium sp.]